MSLYTFFLDYQGGTYISQVHAQTHSEAPKIWIKELDWTSIPKVERKFRNKLLSEIELEKPIEIEGLNKTWCLSPTIADNLALVHFTQTVE